MKLSNRKVGEIVEDVMSDLGMVERMVERKGDVEMEVREERREETGTSKESKRDLRQTYEIRLRDKGKRKKSHMS